MGLTKRSPPVQNLLKPGDELYIAEGCSDCWTMLSAGNKDYNEYYLQTKAAVLPSHVGN